MNQLRSTASLALAVFASLAALTVLADPKASESNHAASTDVSGSDKPREVKVEAFADNTVCRSERPTGTKIAVKRCYTRGKAETQQESAANAITRQEIDELRRQQLYYEQVNLARQLAMRQQALQRGPQ